MQITDKSQLKEGQLYYLVYALGEGSHMRLFLCDSEPYKQANAEHGSWWIEVGLRSSVGFFSIPEEYSLRDMGIVPNDYNHHKVFDDEKEAIAHIDQAKKDPPPRYSPVFADESELDQDQCDPRLIHLDTDGEEVGIHGDIEEVPPMTEDEIRDILN